MGFPHVAAVDRLSLSCCNFANQGANYDRPIGNAANSRCGPRYFACSRGGQPGRARITNRKAMISVSPSPKPPMSPFPLWGKWNCWSRFVRTAFPFCSDFGGLGRDRQILLSGKDGLWMIVDACRSRDFLQEFGSFQPWKILI